MLLDYLDCVLHVFTPDARERFRLEQLWGEADSWSWRSTKGRLGLIAPDGR